MTYKKVLASLCLSALILTGCSSKAEPQNNTPTPTVTDKADGGNDAAASKEVPSPTQAYSLANADGETVRTSLGDAFGSDAVQEAFGINYDTFPNEEDKRILELNATGALPVNGVERNCEVVVSVTGEAEFSSPEEFEDAWNEAANAREVDISWTTDEQDLQKVVEDARVLAGLPEAEEKLDHGGLGIGLVGHCDVNGKSVEWRIDTMADVDDEGQPQTLLMVSVG